MFLLCRPFSGYIEQSGIICAVNSKQSPTFALFKEHIAGACDCRSLIVIYNVIYNAPLCVVKFWLPFWVTRGIPNILTVYIESLRQRNHITAVIVGHRLCGFDLVRV